MNVKTLNPLRLQTEVIFIFLAIIFGSIFIHIVPPLWGLDEIGHINRAYELSGGNLGPNKINSEQAKIPITLLGLEQHVYIDLTNDAESSTSKRPEVDSINAYKMLLNKPFSAPTAKPAISSTYSLLAYPGPTAGVLLGRALDLNIGHTIFIARFLSLLIYMFMVFCALRLLRESKVRWLIFVVALLPVSLFQASVISADSILIGLSLIFVALFLRILKSKPHEDVRKLKYMLATVAVLIPLVKLNYILLSAAIFLIPRTTLYKKILTLCAALISGLGWFLLSNHAADPSLSPRPDGLMVESSGQIQFILHHPIQVVEILVRTLFQSGDYYVNSAISLLGWHYAQLPWEFTLLACIGILLAAIFATSELLSLKKYIVLLNIFTFLAIISVFIVLYIAFNPVGNHIIDGVQGRYFIPFFAPLAMLLAVLPNRKFSINLQLSTILFSSVSTICLLASVAYFYAVTY